jgi:type I restriction enzyme S subunit
MNKKTKPLVPKLRFPEFWDAGEWDKCSLGQLATLYKGKGISKSDINPNGSQPCIRYGELYTLYGEVIDKVVSKTELPPSDLFLSCEDDVIIPSSGETKIDIATAACVKHKNIALGGDLNVIRSNHNGNFLSYQLNGPLRHEIAKVAQGDTVAHLYKSNLEKLALALPSPEEQQKIADCLSSLDALIATQAEKIGVLKTHKKGLMQQLFPREGETVPRLRFPEFRDSGEWEEKPISKIGEVVTGRTPSTTDKSHYGGGAMFVSPADISDQCFVTETVKNLTNKGLSKARIIPARSILFVCIGSTIGKIAQNMYDCATNQQINAIIPFSQYVNDFVYYGLELTSEKIAELAGKQAVPIINKTLFSTALLSVPPDKDEQQKIADCLSPLDALIAAQEEKIDALKDHKKGLMQQLFPNPEAVV